MADPKLTDDDRRMIAARVQNGETRSALAKEYDVAVGTIRKAIDRVQAGKMPTPGMPPVSIVEFRSRARKILWRLNTGKEKVQYDRWKAMCKDLKGQDGMSADQAIVQASKSFDALKPLFATCDVSALDPNPGSHADIVHYKEDSDRLTTKCLDKKLSNQDNLKWAIEAAGKFLGERIEPEECPNWAAYYLYNQARSDPNNFTGKYLTTVSKIDDDKDDELRRRAGKRAVAEINEMIEILNQKPEESTNGN
ncbi:MAG: hypothetical protein NWE89_00900 [Candidatus Bathyarchaeota archaeon]|nr:hypothetical protein [Candidatus Bathyarchaeota archaeon]